MKHLMLAALMLAVPAALPAQAPPAAAPLPAVTLPPELDRVLRDYERLWHGRDAAGLAAIFTSDGFVPSRTGWRRGTAAITEQYGNAGGELRLRAHAFATGDSVGYLIGAYQYGEGPGGGKFILALRRGTDGRWLIAADLDQSNR